MQNCICISAKLAYFMLQISSAPSAANLKSLSVSLQSRHMNFKFKAALDIFIF